MSAISIRRLLIANRGEIAIRIARSANDLGIASVAIAPDDDMASRHTRCADQLVRLSGAGAKAYLDMAQVVDAATAAGCDAIHPGYGFLSENADFAEACADAGLVFVGPAPEMLRAFGDKARARALARQCGVPTPEGVFEPVDLDGARDFVATLAPGAAVILKAVAGGGGRGIRVVRNLDDLPAAFERCASEARVSFGRGELYIERYLPRARHIEVQIIGDGQGGIAHLWERECSLQRRHQKLVEIAPSPSLPAAIRQRLLDASVALAQAVGYRSLGTFEFLVWDEGGGAEYAFIEANPRIQVEHTVTEEVTGVDLVAAQLMVAGGSTLPQIGLTQAEAPSPAGHAIQLRINMERMKANGQVLPSGGTLARFEPPSGPGVRVDTFGYAGYRTSAAYDSLLAKVIVHAPGPDFATAVRRAERALREFDIAGVATNRDFLRALLARPEMATSAVHTTFVDEHVADLVDAAGRLEDAPRAEDDTRPAPVETERPDGGAPPSGRPALAPLQGTLLSLRVGVGGAVAAGAEIAILEAMKMEHVVTAPVSGVVVALVVQPGQTVLDGDPILWIEEGHVEGEATAVAAERNPDHIRPDLAAVLEARGGRMDEARPEAVEKRHGRNMRTARENIAAVCDPGTFQEYGGLAVAPQRKRRAMDDLIRNTPADGLVVGVGSVNGALFGPQKSRAVVLAYDATVLAGTQGHEGHRKDSRILELAARLKLPVVFFAEGGGGRPGDTEYRGELDSFHRLPALSGKVPMVGIAAGYCFAGNAAFLGSCDVIIATETSNIGMGGPAMIEGGGLGVYTPGEIGPARMHYETGVVDVLVKDEAEAAEVAKRYLGFFQGDTPPTPPRDQRLLRHIVPEDRRRAYDVRPVIDILADEGSVLELRAGFGLGVITALIRIEGRAVGVLANNPMHLAGAVDGDGSDKGARFITLCDNFGIPVLFLCDTPGIMVGPEAEKTALVRRSSRLLVASANLRVPAFTIILRKFYGIGMMAMMMGALKAPLFTVSWPTGEFGSMGLEGAVRLAYRKEMAAIEDPAERKRFYDEHVEQMYQAGKALRRSRSYEFDDVIDPAETRQWIVHALNSSAALPGPDAPRHPYVSPW